MRPGYAIATVLAVTVLAFGLFYFVDIDQTEEAKLPDVDVTVEGGNLPEYKVETGSVDVGTKKTTIKVPEVNMVEKEVTVPTVDVEPATE